MSQLGLAITRAYRARLEAALPGRVVEVRLYGSHAKGGSHEDSDVDVLATVRGLTWSEKVRAVDLAAELGLERGVTVSAVVMAPEAFERLIALESAFAGEVRREGRLV